MGVSGFQEDSLKHARVARQAKIIGGNIAEPNEFPYQVHLKYNNDLLCGGTILSSLFILTAAHCLKYRTPNRLKVTAGDHHRNYLEGPEQERNVSHVFMHEEYNWDTDVNDIALIALQIPLDFNEFVGSIPRPKDTNTEFEEMAIVTGWGKEVEFSPSGGSEILLKTKVPIVNKVKCKSQYRPYRMTITDSMMCAGQTGKDACQGDSGGPLTCQLKGTTESVVCGVVSHGRGCGRYGFPGVYTDVSHYTKWIENTMDKYLTKGKCKQGDFYCPEDKSCIPRRRICDEKRDCSKGSDEGTCKSQSPSSRSQFRCDNGMSIKSTWVCDNIDDCGDHSDEDRCNFRGNTTCRSDYFVCKSTGRCIDKSWKCDEMVDCDDESDETDCSPKNLNSSTLSTSTPSPPGWNDSSICLPDNFECSGVCVPNRWICDGDLDCQNGDDEKNCSKTTTNCTKDEFLCSSFSSGGFCIPKTFKCDGDKDCINGQDEENCEVLNARPLNCSAEQFHCPEFMCIPISFKCDGERDCLTGVDEIGCGLVKCKENQFQCHASIGNRCIPKSFKCDGEKDCSKGEDEDGCSLVSNNITSSTTSTSFSTSTSTTTTTTIRPTRPTRKPCGNNEFQCRTSGNCISQNFLCDLDSDCEDGSDEIGCRSTTSITCAPFQWRCKNGDCIYHRFRCDDDVDCIDESDEQHCTSRMTRAAPTERRRSKSYRRSNHDRRQ